MIRKLITDAAVSNPAVAARLIATDRVRLGEALQALLAHGSSRRLHSRHQV
jgi:hypothetical protein